MIFCLRPFPYLVCVLAMNLVCPGVLVLQLADWDESAAVAAPAEASVKAERHRPRFAMSRQDRAGTCFDALDDECDDERESDDSSLPFTVPDHGHPPRHLVLSKGITCPSIPLASHRLARARPLRC